MRERIVRAVAGAFVLTSITLAYFINIDWLWLAYLLVSIYYNRLLLSFARWKKYWILPV
jgi:hypothetical protein